MPYLSTLLDSLSRNGFPSFNGALSNSRGITLNLIL